MRRAHPAAVSVEQNPDQKAWLLAHLPVGSVDAILGEDGLHIVPEGLVDDGLMLAWIALVLVDDFTTIDPVLQHQVDGPAGERLSTIPAAIRSRPDLADNASAIEVLLQFPD